MAVLLPPAIRRLHCQMQDTTYSLPIQISRELLIFRIPRGNAFTDDERRWGIAHTEENVRRIAETGERMLKTHFYKGYGFEA